MPDYGNPDAVVLGPGFLYVAPIGTPEPSDATSALPSAYREVGYTENGSELQYATTTAKVNVDEELDAILTITTARDISYGFSMAEGRRANLALAWNLGAAEADDGTALEPPDPGDEIRVMLVWQSYDNNDVATVDADRAVRHLVRKTYQNSAVTMAMRKGTGAEKRLLPVVFVAEKPDNAKPIKIFPSTTGLIA